MVHLRTLGAISLLDDAGEPVGAILRQPKRLALLAYLALARPRGFHRRDTLLALFWPEQDAERARGSLRQALYTLRRHLPAELLMNRGDGEIGLSPGRLWCDVHEMERRIQEGQASLALELYGGELLPGFHVGDASPELDRWIEGERARVHRLAVTAAVSLVEAAEAGGDLEEAVRRAAQAAALSPLDEDLACREIELRHRAGDRAGALRAFEIWSERLAGELELEPLPTTLALVERVRASAGTARPAALPPAGLPAPAPQDPVRPGGPGQAADPPGVPADAMSPAPPSRRWRRGVGIAAAGAAVVLGVWLVATLGSGTPGRRDAAAVPTAARLLVLPFSYHGPGDAQYLSEGLVHLFSVALDGEDLRAVDPLSRGRAATEITEPAVYDADVGAELAGRVRAGHFLVGSVVETNGQLQLTASLYERDGAQPVARATAAGRHDEVLSLVDAVAAELLTARLGRPAPRAARVAAVTTHSLPALKAYLAGERFLRQGRYEDAITAYERAVAQDSLFALAHYRISQAGSWAFRGDLSNRAAALASRHADRLPERERRLVLAHEAYRRGHATDARAALQELAALYPDDPEVWFRLGEVRLHFGPLEGWRISEAREPFMRATALDPGSPAALYHLAQLAAMEADTAAALRAIDRALDAAPSASRALQLRLLRTLLGDADGLQEMLNALTRADEFTVVSSVYNAAIYARRPDVAGFAARHLTAPSRSASTRAFGHLLLTDLELALGRTAAARSHLGELARMDPERAEIHRAMLAAAPGAGLDWMPPIGATLASDHRQGGEEDRWRPEAALGTLPATYAGGLLAALAGDRAGVREAIARIEADSSAPGDYAGDLRLAAATRFVATAARDVPSPRFEVGAEQAILSPFLSRPVRRYLEGRRLEAAGRPRDALVWYGSLEGFAVGDLPWGIPALLDRARIHEMLGEDVEAAALYRRYAALRAWADDPEPRRFALGRLARLEASRDR